MQCKKRGALRTRFETNPWATHHPALPPLPSFVSMTEEMEANVMAWLHIIYSPNIHSTVDISVKYFILKSDP